jgi:hypothetical protein
MPTRGDRIIITTGIRGTPTSKERRTFEYNCLAFAAGTDMRLRTSLLSADRQAAISNWRNDAT